MPIMCGFAGLLNPKTNQSRDWYQQRLESMTNAIRHRGPDDSAYWVEAERGLAMGFRRLSILDLSVQGRQPMESACGRYTLVFNGEIYNHSEIKQAVIASDQFHFEFRGRSDTETLLAGFTVWGVEATLKKTNGMFALAVWDRESHCLLMGRDRLGEKPLYYGWAQDLFIFGSELKSFMCLPEFSKTLDKKALNLFFRHSCIPAPYSVFEKVKKLPPGCFLKWSPNQPATVEINRYWSAQDVCVQGVKNPFTGTFEEAEEKLHELLKDAVKLRMEADVPLGAFLSGGIDSSLIVALMQKQSSVPIRTFTIGFEEARFDESEYARKVSQALHTHHTELKVTAKEAQSVIPLLPSMFDEPFSDASQIPTYLLAHLTRQSVTVSLSGDGGDELFGGYDRYIYGQNFWNKFSEFPISLKKPLATLLNLIPSKQWEQGFRALEPFLPPHWHWKSPGEKIKKLQEALRVTNPLELYTALTSHFNPPSSVTFTAEEYSTQIKDAEHLPLWEPISQGMMYLDLVSYLPDDILVKVDRATMAVSLEGRMPLLDHRLVEFAWKLPPHFKIQDGEGKAITKKMLNRYLPETLYQRPKMGFSVPVGEWIRGPLKDWAESLLNHERIHREGYLNPQQVETLWREHLSGARNHEHRLWDLLQFQNWLTTCIY